MNAVVSVPTYFNKARRQAMRESITLAGLKVSRIIGEATCAAEAYGLGGLQRVNNLTNHTFEPSNILVFDLGSRTINVSLITYQVQRFYEVQATAGSAQVGGDAFDDNLLEYFCKQFQFKYKKNLRNDHRAMRRLRTACERAKRTLSSTTRTAVGVDALFKGLDFSEMITRARFEELNMDVFRQCVEQVTNVLLASKLYNASQVHEVVLVGGSTHIPKIQALLMEFFNGKELNKSINPVEVVAKGAAIQATMLRY